jgi:hypothetical protein
MAVEMAVVMIYPTAPKHGGDGAGRNMLQSDGKKVGRFLRQPT